jgi:hypothetical protein
MMKRMITLVDLRTGAVIARPSNTFTLDVPGDLDSGTAVASLDGRSHVLYRAATGKDVSRAVHPRPLSWRVQGEECLVAEEGSAGGPGRYMLCAVEPMLR